MKTTAETIEYLKAEMAEAHDLHQQALRDRDNQQALLHLIRAATIKGILEEIRKA